MRTTSDWLLIERTPKNLVSEGGIHLPETHMDFAPEGTVRAAGPGRLFANGASIVFAEPGMTVLFKEREFHPYGNDREAARGFVRDSDLLAWIDHENITLPLNSYAKIEGHGREARSEGGIYIADRARRLPKCGIVMTYGYGTLRLSGPMAGTRRTIPEILNTEPGELSGAMAHWTDAKDEFFSVEEPDGGSFFLVPAEALILLETY